MKVTIQIDIEPEDLELNAGDFNRKMVKQAQELHIQFMDHAVNQYKLYKENIDLETLPKAALPRWQ